MTRPVSLILASLALPWSASAGTKQLEPFEGADFGEWQTQGTAFGQGPVAGKTQEMKSSFLGYSNESLAASAHGGDAATGSLTSPEFKLSEPYLTFLLAGGDYAGKTAAQLLIDGEVVREATGRRDLEMRPVLWDVREFAGATARLRVIDEERGPWGIIGIDHILLTDYPNQKFPVSTRGGKPFIEGLVQTEALPGVTIPRGSRLRIAADHKGRHVTSPTALTFDGDGRVYLSETHRFRHGVEDDRDRLFWYLDDLAAQTTADRRAMLEKWKDKVSPSYLTEKSEVIRVLSEENGEGVFQRDQVFAEGFNDPLDGTGAGVFFYDGTLYFACIPKLWMLRDTDGDGVADQREVIEDGFGVRVSLSGHDLNGFTLGPDGRIYGTIGDRGFHLTTKEGKTYQYPNEGAAFRFEPDGSAFEVFHTGLRNPKEIIFDALGNAFSVDNNSDQGDAARIVYLVEGGDSGWQMEHQAMHTFHRQIGLEERPPSRWMDEKMWEMENDFQPAYLLPPSAHLTAGPSGLTVHPGTGFLETEAGRFLICDYRGGAANSGVWSFAMEADGAGMKLSDARRFAWGVAATDVEYSWDGRVFISDFVGGWNSHEDGRVLALDAGDDTWRAEETAHAATLVREGFGQRDAEELAGLLRHPDARIRLRAQIALTRKPEALERFTAAAASPELLERVHGIWGLGILARRGAPVPEAAGAPAAATPDESLRGRASRALAGLLAHEDAETRAQALRALADGPLPEDAAGVIRLLQDPSPRVRFAAAIAIGKLGLQDAAGAVVAFLAETNDRDRYLRHAGVYALQHAVADPDKLALLRQSDSPAVQLAAVVALRRMHAKEVAWFLNSEFPAVTDEAVRAITDLSLDEARPAAARLLDDLPRREWRPFLLRRLIHNAFRTGTPENAERLLRVAADGKLPEEVRKEALRLLAHWQKPHPVDQLTAHWAPLPERDPQAIRPVLEAALPQLLQQDGFVLTAALGLIETFHLDIGALDDGTLRGLVSNGALPASARAKALDLYLERAPAGLNAFLQSLAGDGADEVALAALSGLVQRDPQAALAPLESALSSKKAHRAQQAWGLIAPIPGPAAADILVRQLQALREAQGISPHALELMEAARSRPEPQVAEALSALQTVLKESSDPLAKWYPSLEGGDPKVGASLFQSHPAGQCMRCHRAGDGHSAGGEAGPNLAGIGNRHDRRYLLESMILPGAVVAPGYGLVSLRFPGGGTLGGALLEETDDHLDLDVAGKRWRVNRAHIESFTPPVSAMPPMADLLQPGELRDLVAWLAELKKGGEKPNQETPEPFDPATLTISTGETDGSAPEPSAREPESEAPPAPESSSVPAPGEESGSTTPDPEFHKMGQQQFAVCGACHGQAGEGTAAAPPLAGSEWVNGPAENLIRIQLRGLTGPLHVKGREYNLTMPPMAYQSDEQIAAVLSYVRASFGNDSPPVSAEEVRLLRSEAGQPLMTSKDLVVPAIASPTKTVLPSGKYDHLRGRSSIPGWLYGLAAAGLAAGLLVIAPRRS